MPTLVPVLTPWSMNRSYPSACSTTAEQSAAAIGLEPRDRRAQRHLESLQDLSGLRIDPPQIAFVAFPGAVPELTIHPGNAGHEPSARDGAENRPGFRVDLMDFPLAILTHPERPFGPGKPGVSTAAGCRDCGNHPTGLRIDLLDAILGKLKQVLAVKGCSGMRRNINRAYQLPARRVEGAQFVSGREPDVLTVERYSMHLVDTGKGSILTQYFRH